MTIEELATAIIIGTNRYMVYRIRRDFVRRVLRTENDLLNFCDKHCFDVLSNDEFSAYIQFVRDDTTLDYDYTAFEIRF